MHAVTDPHRMKQRHTQKDITAKQVGDAHHVAGDVDGVQGLQADGVIAAAGLESFQQRPPPAVLAPLAVAGDQDVLITFSVHFSTFD